MGKYILLIGIFVLLAPTGSLFAEWSAGGGAEGWSNPQDTYFEGNPFKEKISLGEELEIEESSEGLPPLEDSQAAELAVIELTDGTDPTLAATIRSVFEE